MIPDPETGERVRKDVPVRFRRWWWSDDTGNVMLDVRYGNRRIELQPGKPTIEVGAAENLLPTIQAVRETVAAGELDKLLRFQKKLPTYKLLIIDELGFVPLSKTGAELSPPLTYCPAILMQ